MVRLRQDGEALIERGELRRARPALESGRDQRVIDRRRQLMHELAPIIQALHVVDDELHDRRYGGR